MTLTKKPRFKPKPLLDPTPLLRHFDRFQSGINKINLFCKKHNEIERRIKSRLVAFSNFVN